MNIEIVNIAVPEDAVPQLRQLIAPYLKRVAQKDRALTPDQEWQAWQLRTTLEVLKNLEQKS